MYVWWMWVGVHISKVVGLFENRLSDHHHKVAYALLQSLLSLIDNEDLAGNLCQNHMQRVIPHLFLHLAHNAARIRTAANEVTQTTHIYSFHIHTFSFLYTRVIRAIRAIRAFRVITSLGYHPMLPLPIMLT